MTSTRKLPNDKPMKALPALVLMMTFGALAIVSFRANKQAERSGRHRFLIWRIPDWGDRARNPVFYRLVQLHGLHRTVVLAFLTLIAGLFFLNANGLFR